MSILGNSSVIRGNDIVADKGTFNEIEVATIDFPSSVKCDEINEETLNAGVTIEGVLIKDSIISGASYDFTNILCDTIDEETLNAGVTIEGNLLKDSIISTDTINEKTLNSGVSIDGVLLKDSIVNTNIINEKTLNAGTTIEGILLKDSIINTNTINENTLDSGVTIEGITLEDSTMTTTGNLVINTGLTIANDGSIVCIDDEYPVFSFQRNTAETGGTLTTLTGLASAANCKTVSTSDIGTGYGGGLIFNITGNNQADTVLSRIYSRVESGTNIGSFQIWNKSGATDYLSSHHGISQHLWYLTNGTEYMKLNTNGLYINTINEETTSNGVTVNNLNIKHVPGTISMQYTGGTVNFDNSHTINSNFYFKNTNGTNKCNVGITGNLTLGGVGYGLLNCNEVQAPTTDELYYRTQTGYKHIFKIDTTTFSEISSTGLKIDAISELTANNGTTIESLNIKDGNFYKAGDEWNFDHYNAGANTYSNFHNSHGSFYNVLTCDHLKVGGTQFAHTGRASTEIHGIDSTNRYAGIEFIGSSDSYPIAIQMNLQRGISYWMFDSFYSSGNHYSSYASGNFGFRTSTNNYLSIAVSNDTPVGNTITWNDVMRFNKTGFVESSAILNTTITSAQDVHIDSSGKLGYVSSIRDSKANISEIPSVDSNKLYELTPVKFNYKKIDETTGEYTNFYEEDQSYGLIAEDVEPIFPELCVYKKNVRTDNINCKFHNPSSLCICEEIEENGVLIKKIKDNCLYCKPTSQCTCSYGNKLKSVHYNKLVPLLLKAVQDLKTENESLKTRVTTLEQMY